MINTLIESSKMWYQKLLKVFLYILWPVFVVAPIVISMWRAGVDCDSSYYLSIGERIVDGYIPYSSLSTGYTPLWLYLEAGFKLLLNIPNGLYWPYLLLYYLFELSTAYVLYLIIRQFSVSKDLSFFIAGLFLLIIHWLNGNCVLLEVPYLFWGLLSCYLVLSIKTKAIWAHFLIGVIASFSFLTKQYGAIFFILGLFLYTWGNKTTLRTVLPYVIGFFVPFCVCVIIWQDSFIGSVFLNGYGTKTITQRGGEVTLLSKAISISEGLFYFFKFVCPAVLASLLYYPGAAVTEKRALLFTYLGIILLSFQFFFSFSLHYLIPLVPFGLITLSVILSNKNKKLLYILSCIVCIFMVFTASYKTYFNRVWKQYYKSNVRSEQIVLANAIKEIVGPEETLFIIHTGLISNYFLSQRIPPNLAKIGYSFGPQGLNHDTAIKQIKDADWILRYSKDYPYESFFTDDLKLLLEKSPTIELEDGEVLLHKNVLKTDCN